MSFSIAKTTRSRSRFFVHKTPGFRISSAWAQMRKDRLGWIGLLNLIASLASTLGGKIHWSGTHAENLGDSWSPWWWFLDQRRPGVKRIGWAVLPGHVPPGFRQVQLPLAATYEARPKILLKLPLFRLFAACICLRFLFFFGKFRWGMSWKARWGRIKESWRCSIPSHLFVGVSSGAFPSHGQWHPIERMRGKITGWMNLHLPAPRIVAANDLWEQNIPISNTNIY